MANTAKNAILRAKLNGVLTELLVKTNAANVIVDDQGTTLAAYLLTLAKASDLDSLAKQSDLESLQQIVNALGDLATKDKVSISDLDEALAKQVNDMATSLGTITGDVSTLDGKVSTLIGEDAGKSARTIANEELAAQLIGEGAKESLDTLAEIAAWIQDHPDDASAMNEAIVALQNKVDTGDQTVSAYVTAAITALNIGDYAKAQALTDLAGRVETAEGEIDALQTTANNLKAMAYKDIVSESDLAAELAEKVNAASEGNHSHLNKELLDTYDQTNVDLKDAVAKKHSHANATVLDGITAESVAAWNEKATIYYAAEQPTTMVDGDLWVQLVD